MSTESLPKCPQCGAPLKESAAAGLCPNCLMALNLKTETVLTGDKPDPQPPLLPGQIAPHFPQLEIFECLGRGGMGIVYKARQKTLNRLVALKLMAPERAGDTKFAERFAREAQALAALNHPNIVTIHDFGQAGGFYFLLMEFVDGVNLRQLLRSRKFTPEEALSIVPPLCDALQFAHERGIVHRDIKPENLLLDKAGRVKVADFGIAKILGATGNFEGVGGSATPESSTREAVGTPGYSAPEQKSDPQRVDSRADIYSLGVVFYEMLTGELPGKRIELPSRKVQIDVRLDGVVLKALEKTPELRWQTAAELRTQVETIATGPGVPPAQSVTARDLNIGRWKSGLWGFALAAAGWSMNLVLGIYGVSMFVTATTLALFFGHNLKARQITKRLILSDGIVMASAGIWYAFNTPMLPTAWLVTIVVACLGGIVYCLSCWVKSKTKFFLVQVPVTFVILLALRIFVLQPFKAATDAAAPETPRGSQFLVWKLSHHFASGDLIAYRWNGWPNVGRVVSSEGGVISVNRNGRPDITVSLDDILGKVVSVYWRTSYDGSMIVLRPADVKEHGSFDTSDNQIEAHAVPLCALISYAYGPSTTYIHWSGDRVILPPEISGEKFDFQIPDSVDPQEALQAVIKKQLGLVAHYDLIETNVLILEVSNPGATGLEVANGSDSSDSHPRPGDFEFANQPIGDLADYLEHILCIPVVNGTSLDQKYTGSLKWDSQSDPASQLKEIQTTLSGQLGLELIPGRQPISFLIVERGQ